MLFDTFKDTIFIKKSSDLQKRYDALNKLLNNYPESEEISEELFIIKKGLQGEKEIEYQLKKSNLGLYVLNDINIEYEDMKAQIDYIVINKAYTYFIECKNLIGNITINDKGDFIREYTYKNKTVKKGMYSPLRQVEAQRDVYKKIWNNSLSDNKILNSIKRFIAENNFKSYHRVLVVTANNETILNTKYAPADIKNKVIKSDSLVRQLEYDLNHSDKSIWENRKSIEERANFYTHIDKENNIDYYEYYKNKYIKENPISDEKIKQELIEFRKQRAKEMELPAYYIFTNEELDKIVESKPKTIEELKSLNILERVKVNTHGKQIVEKLNIIINSKN